MSSKADAQENWNRRWRKPSFLPSWWVEGPHDLIRETVCELANQVNGNAVTALNDQGFRFRVHPPVLHTSEHGSCNSEDTEALVISFETGSGSVFMNIALRYNVQRPGELATAAGQ